MTTNPNSMTFSAVNDTKSAAKQELTFFFLGETPASGGTGAKCARNGYGLQKKKVVTCV